MWNDAVSSTIISPPRDATDFQVATGQGFPVEALADDEFATERLRAKNGYPGRVRTRQTAARTPRQRRFTVGPTRRRDASCGTTHFRCARRE
jgi:hypothetical protein